MCALLFVLYHYNALYIQCMLKIITFGANWWNSLELNVNVHLRTDNKIGQHCATYVKTPSL